MRLSAAYLTLASICWSPLATAQQPATAAQAPEPTTEESQAAKAEEWFERGRDSYARRQYRDAALAFEHAARLVPHGATAYNAAVAWAASQDSARAANAYEQALELGSLRGQDEIRAGEELKRLRASLGRVSVSCDGAANVDIAGLLLSECPAESFVIPGRHSVSVKFEDGSVQSRSVSLDAGRAVSLTFHARVVSSPPRKVIAPQSAPFPWYSVALGAAGASTAAALILGGNGLDARDEFDRSGRVDADARNRAIKLRTYANVAWLGAAALGATGIVLFVSDDFGGATTETAARGKLSVGLQSVHYKAEF